MTDQLTGYLDFATHLLHRVGNSSQIRIYYGYKWMFMVETSMESIIPQVLGCLETFRA